MKSLTEYIIEQQRIDEMDAKTAAMTHGANVNAQNHDDSEKANRAVKVGVDALNHMLGQKLPDLQLQFFEEVTIDWGSLDAKDLKFVQLKPAYFLLEAQINLMDEGWKRGYIRYTFKDKRFAEVHFQRNGSLRNPKPLKIRKRSAEQANNLVAFTQEWLEYAAEYERQANEK